MSGAIRKTKKNLVEMPMYFPNDMYSNIYGSIVVCGAIFNNISAYKRNEIRKLWLKVKRKPSLIDFDFQDPDFIDKTLNFFGLERPDNFPVAMVSTGYSCLIVPYLKMHWWQRKKIYPLREDGFITTTLKYGKIYPIKFKKKEVV